MEIEYYTLLDILNKNKDRIEKGQWEEVYESIPHSLRGDFSDFLIDNGIDPNNLFREYVPEKAFFRSSKLTSIKLPSSIEMIEPGAFAECFNLEDANLGNGVNHICGAAFAKCQSLKHIKIPHSVNIIGDLAFQDAHFVVIEYDGSEDDWNRIEKGFGWNYQGAIEFNFMR